MRLATSAVVLFVAALSSSIQAQGTRKLTIHSPYDTFDLILSSQARGSVDGKPADLKSLKDLWTVLNSSLSNDCPSLKGKADVTVTEAGKTRSIYVQQGVVSDGKGCLNIGGDGLFYFPVHRDFLIGAKQESIELKSPVRLSRQGVKIMEIAKEQGEWTSQLPNQMLNWDFIERLENSLKRYDVRLRVQTGIGQGKTKVVIQSGDQSYEFFRVTDSMWAVKKPGTNWLTASDEWGFWYDFDASLIEDRFAPEIRTLRAADTPDEERMAAMGRLEGSWSRNLRDVYHQILLEQNASNELKLLALKRLKSKPSQATTLAVAEFFVNSQDEEHKQLAGQILKLHYNKGPLYKKSLPANEKAKVAEFWDDWWKQNRKAN